MKMKNTARLISKAKTRSISTLLAAIMVLTSVCTFSFDAFAQEEQTLELFAESQVAVIPGKSTHLHPFEYASTGTSAVTSYGLEEVLAISKFKGENVSSSILQNNIYNLTTSYPDIYAKDYKYAEIVYYYKTPTPPSEDYKMDIEVAFTKNAATGEKSSYVVYRADADRTFEYNCWTSAFFDLSGLGTSHPALVADGFAYEHLRLATFGRRPASEIDASDTVYIKEMKFYKQDPRPYAQSTQVYYYENSNDATAGENSIFSDTWRAAYSNTLKSPGGNVEVWVSTSGKKYYPGQSYNYDCTAPIHLYPEPTEYTKTVYVSESGSINNVTGQIYTDLAQALNGVGVNSAVIYVSGTTTLPTDFGGTGGRIRVCGYNGTSDVVAANTSKTVFKRDVIFDDITIKSQPIDERWLYANGAKVTIAQSCGFIQGQGSNGTKYSLYIGASSAANEDAVYNFNSPDVMYAMVAPTSGYVGSKYIVNSNVLMNLNDGFFSGVFGGVRNGYGLAPLYQEMNGDAVININGGVYSYIYTNNAGVGTVNGNIMFNINGGTLSSKRLVYGNSSEGLSQKAKANSVTVKINADKLVEAGKSAQDLIVEQRKDFSSMDIKYKMFIINYAENSTVIPTSVSIPNVDYKIKVNGGSASPVFSKALPTKGELLGFEITNENSEYAPAIDGVELIKNQYGLYNIPKNSNGFVEVDFVNSLSGRFFELSFDHGEGIVETETHEGGSIASLPACKVQKPGYIFTGWNKGGTVYGNTYKVVGDASFTAQWINEGSAFAVYVDSTNGSDEGNGLAKTSAVATLSKAIEIADRMQIHRIVLVDRVNSEIGSITASDNNLIITSFDGETTYDGGLYVNNPLKIDRAVTFEKLRLGCKDNNFIASRSSKLVFGVEIGELSDSIGIYAHLGNEYSAASSIDATVKSGKFKGLYLGGGYFAQENTVAVTGDTRLNIDGIETLSVALGFDGYSGFNSSAVFGGSVVITSKNGNISKVIPTKVAGINGALYLITYNNSIINIPHGLPQATFGNYQIKVIGNGEVTPAVDSEGDILPGQIKISCAPNMRARFSNSCGVETIITSGTHSIAPGSYTVEFFETSALTTARFTIDPPVVGFDVDEKQYATSAYTASAKWYIGSRQIDKFAPTSRHSLKIHIKPYPHVDTSGFNKVLINGNAATLTRNSDGTFTATYNYSLTGAAVVKYVSELTGSDSNNGTKTAPYKTISAAYNAIRSKGGTIYVCDKTRIGYPSMQSTSYNIRITGQGYPDAELYIPDNASLHLAGPLYIDNIKFTMGSSSHVNDVGKKLVIGENVLLNGKLLHIGASGTGNAAPSIAESNITIGQGSAFTIVTLGAYLTNENDGVSGDIKIKLDGGKISTLQLSPDAYSATHTTSTLRGNLLLTLSGDASISKIDLRKNVGIIKTSETTAYHFIYNETDATVAIPTDLVPKEKTYSVRAGDGGIVDHAYDDNGKSISGYFDIIPNEGHIAVITRSGNISISRGGRYLMPAGEISSVMFVDYKHELESLNIELNGGAFCYGMFSVDEQGKIYFDKAPTKNGHIFEGWYADSNYSQIIKNGDYVGSSCSLYAKYIAIPLGTADSYFAVKGIQMRVPSGDGTIVQGLRFVATINNTVLDIIEAFSPDNANRLSYSPTSQVGYGMVVIPTEKLGGKALVYDGKYFSNGKTYSAKNVAAKNIFANDGTNIDFTACITRIKEENYFRDYSARPYIRYYTRSGSITTIYGKTYETSIMDTTYAVLEADREPYATQVYLRENILPVYSRTLGIEFVPTDVLNTVKTKTAQYKQNVLNSANLSTSSIKGTIYYVSPNGSDSNSGKSPSAAWQTISKANSARLSSGDAVLFERGAEFRGKISGKKGVTYSAYGTGAKPVINGSARNYADPSLWETTNTPNVYKLKTMISNVGIIAFNYSGEIGKYDELVGTMRVRGATYGGISFGGFPDLADDLEFFSDLSTNELYLYSALGNPGSRFESIEIGSESNLVSPSGGVVVDNLTFMYGGAHGVGAGGGSAKYDSNGNFISTTGAANLTIKNCVFAWIGGSILKGFAGGDTTRFGNAVEIYGSVNGYTVENNWIYQIYDTGVTHQISSSACYDTMMQDVLYKDNLIEYCHWSIEFYNQPCCDSHRRVTRRVLSTGNIIRFGGFGWGSIGRETGATLYNSFGLSKRVEETYDVVARDNIFFRSKGPIIRVNSSDGEDNLEYEGNLYIQDYGKSAIYYKGLLRAFDKNVESVLTGSTGLINDVNTAGIYYYAP